MTNVPAAYAQFGYTLAFAERTLTAVLLEHLAERGTEPETWYALQLLARRGPALDRITLSEELASSRTLDADSARELLARLEAAGLIRGGATISLTAEGEALHHSLSEYIAAPRARASVAQRDWSQVAVMAPDKATDPLDTGYEWPDSVDTALAEAKRTHIQVDLTVTNLPDWASKTTPAANRRRAMRCACLYSNGVLASQLSFRNLIIESRCMIPPSRVVLPFCAFIGVSPVISPQFRQTIIEGSRCACRHRHVAGSEPCTQQEREHHAEPLGTFWLVTVMRRARRRLFCQFAFAGKWSSFQALVSPAALAIASLVSHPVTSKPS